MRPDEIASALRHAVHERAIPPGHALNQDELARQYGVSRIPLREALRTLAGEGLVIMKPGLGAVVTELRPEEVEELYGLRLRLEPPLAEGIIDHVRRRDIDDLATLVRTMAAFGTEQFEEWSSANYRFHRRLYELCEQRHAVRLVVQVLNLVEPYVRMHAHVLGSRPRMQQTRAATVMALRDGDAVQLHDVIAENIREGRSELVASMSRPGAELLP
ncbi:MAG: GntR family transcriptional regulator [Marmoricola sp.]